jgi:hypothetical protein
MPLSVNAFTHFTFKVCTSASLSRGKGRERRNVAYFVEIEVGSRAGGARVGTVWPV